MPLKLSGKQLFHGLILGLILSACAPAPINPATEASLPEPTVIVTTPVATVPSISESNLMQYTTQNDLSGNHLASGSIALQSAVSLDIPLAGNPLWLVSGPYQDGVAFVAVLENGEAQAFKIVEQTYEPIMISPARLPARMPPLLAVSADSLQLIVPPEDASPLTNPILVNGKLIYIASTGDLMMINQETQVRLPINALVDSRILMDEQGRLLVLTQPTQRYAHGVLGDEIEASAITLIATEPELQVLRTISIPEPNVIEGISAIWADMDQDGQPDIVVTLSNAQNGARLVAFREDGTVLAESEPVGLGYRWRHQIAVAPFAADGPPLLVSIRTPHIGGIVEFFQYNAGKLEIIQEFKGFSTHTIGSRNLDAGLAADFDADGVLELLAPDQSHTALAVISLDGKIVTLPLNNILRTNLSAASVDGKLYVGAGIAGQLKIWAP